VHSPGIRVGYQWRNADNAFVLTSNGGKEYEELEEVVAEIRLSVYGIVLSELLVVTNRS